MAGLAAGGSTGSLTTTLTVASTTAPGTYRVIAMATLDSGTERNTSNNGAVSVPVTDTVPDVPRPDLTVTALTVPATGQTGRPLAITSTVRNAGPAAAGAFTVCRVSLRDLAEDDTDWSSACTIAPSSGRRANDEEGKGDQS